MAGGGGVETLCYLYSLRFDKRVSELGAKGCCREVYNRDCESLLACDFVS